MSKTENGAKVTFDFTHLSALHMDELNKARNTLDLSKIAEVLAFYAVSCPPEWGKPDDPMSYLKLDYRPDFIEVLNLAVAAIQAPIKNSDAPSTST